MKSRAERLEEAFNHHANSTERNNAAGMAETRRAIHRIYTECVPEIDPRTDDEDDYADGWDSCRAETMKNIEGMGK